MNERRMLRWSVIVGFAGHVLCAGCAPAADIGMRMAGAMVEGAMNEGGKSAASAPPEATASEPPNETPCRKKLREWREADGNPRAEPPPHLRCGPEGEWPDESEVRRGGSAPGL
jgi:hypothetical protein